MTVRYPALRPRCQLSGFVPPVAPSRMHRCSTMAHRNSAFGNHLYEIFVNRIKQKRTFFLTDLNSSCTEFCVRTWCEKTCQVTWERWKKGVQLEVSLKEGLPGPCKAVTPSPALLLLLLPPGNPTSHAAAWRAAALINGCILVLARRSKERFQPCQTFRCSPTYCWFFILQMCVWAM